MNTRTPTSTWAEVRAAYLAREGSCAELARRFNLHAEAVSTRCRRERWRTSLSTAEQILER